MTHKGLIHLEHDIEQYERLGVASEGQYARQRIDLQSVVETQR